MIKFKDYLEEKKAVAKGVICPKCGEEISLGPKAKSVESIRCPKCGTVVNV